MSAAGHRLSLYRKAKAQAPHFRVEEIKGGLPQWLPQVFDLLGGALQGKRLGFEEEHVSYALWQSFARTLGERLELVPVTGLVEGLRTVKDTEELALMQEAVRITDEAMTRVIPTIRPGQTERQVAWALEVAMREMGAEGPRSTPSSPPGQTRPWPITDLATPPSSEDRLSLSIWAAR
jgi:Xaa-Pro aminopeptidase